MAICGSQMHHFGRCYCAAGGLRDVRSTLFRIPSSIDSTPPTASDAFSPHQRILGLRTPSQLPVPTVDAPADADIISWQAPNVRAARALRWTNTDFARKGRSLDGDQGMLTKVDNGRSRFAGPVALWRG